MQASLPHHRAVVVDTNIFVAAGFNRNSASARILEHVRSGRLRMVWNDRTRGEVRRIVRQIPPLSWDAVQELFRADHRFPGECLEIEFAYVPDPDDRKFAALAWAAGAILITNDEHLLGSAARAGPEIMTPGEYCRRERL